MAAEDAFEIPLIASPQSFQIQLGGVTYTLTFQYQDTDDGGWTLNIADAQEVPIVSGIPLVTGADLLEQYGYLDFGGQLIVQSDSNPGAVPTFANLGDTAHLYWVPNA